MAENKKSFLIYTEWIDILEALDDDEAGKLMKHLFRYINDLDPVAPDKLTEISFIPIKQALKRNLKSWESIREKRSKAGTISAEKRKLEKAKIATKPTKSTSVKLNQQTSTKSTVNVSVNVNDNVNVIKDKVLLCSITFSDELLSSSLFNRIAFNYWNLFKKNLSDSGIKNTKSLDKADLNEWSNVIQLMIEKDKRTPEELKIVHEFLKVNEFWKTNIQSIKKLRIQFEQLFLNAKTKNHGKIVEIDTCNQSQVKKE